MAGGGFFVRRKPGGVGAGFLGKGLAAASVVRAGWARGSPGLGRLGGGFRSSLKRDLKVPSSGRDESPPGLARDSSQ